MQEIHQSLYWNELETNLYFVLITIQRHLNTPIKICFELLPLPNVALLICESSLTLISHFFLISDNFQNAYVTSDIHISAK